MKSVGHTSLADEPGEEGLGKLWVFSFYQFEPLNHALVGEAPNCDRQSYFSNYYIQKVEIWGDKPDGKKMKKISRMDLGLMGLSCSKFTELIAFPPVLFRVDPDLYFCCSFFFVEGSSFPPFLPQHLLLWWLLSGIPTQELREKIPINGYRLVFSQYRLVFAPYRYICSFSVPIPGSATSGHIVQTLISPNKRRYAGRIVVLNST